MSKQHLTWVGLIGAGLVAGIGLPKIWPRARMAARRATGKTYRSGFADRGVRPTADPSRGRPA